MITILLFSFVKQKVSPVANGIYNVVQVNISKCRTVREFRRLAETNKFKAPVRGVREHKDLEKYFASRPLIYIVSCQQILFI